MANIGSPEKINHPNTEQQINTAKKNAIAILQHQYQNRFIGLNYNPDEIALLNTILPDVTNLLTSVVDPGREIILNNRSFPIYVKYEVSERVFYTLDISDNNFELNLYQKHDILANPIDSLTRDFIYPDDPDLLFCCTRINADRNVRRPFEDTGSWVRQLFDDVIDYSLKDRVSPDFICQQSLSLYQAWWNKNKAELNVLLEPDDIKIPYTFKYSYQLDGSDLLIRKAHIESLTPPQFQK